MPTPDTRFFFTNNVVKMCADGRMIRYRLQAVRTEMPSGLVGTYWYDRPCIGTSAHRHSFAFVRRGLSLLLLVCGMCTRYVCIIPGIIYIQQYATDVLFLARLEFILI